MFVCPVCRFESEAGGPSDHEPWCACFMRGPISLEGELRLEGLEEAVEPGAVHGV